MNQNVSKTSNGDFNVVYMESIKKGDKFKCIKDVVMEGSGTVAYTSGQIYESERDGHITNNFSQSYHEITEDFLPIHFIKVSTWTAPDGHDFSYPVLDGPIYAPEPAEPPSPDYVNHPPHYTSHPSGIECIQVTEHYNFCIGNAIKYLWRNGLKSEEGKNPKDKQVEDLKKAVFYINREIERLTK